MSERDELAAILGAHKVAMASGHKPRRYFCTCGSATAFRSHIQHVVDEMAKAGYVHRGEA